MPQLHTWPLQSAQQERWFEVLRDEAGPNPKQQLLDTVKSDMAICDVADAEPSIHTSLGTLAFYQQQQAQGFTGAKHHPAPVPGQAPLNFDRPGTTEAEAKLGEVAQSIYSVPTYCRVH